jgi:hypothetical protein
MRVPSPDRRYLFVSDGDAVGYSSYQTRVNGEWPEQGLKAENSFIEIRPPKENRYRS